MGNMVWGNLACFWPLFLFPPVVPRVSKPGTVNKCLFSAQVCVADPNSMAGKPGACPSSLSKLKNKNNKTILYHSLPHFLCLLTQRELEICMWADVYVCVSESVSRLHCCGVVATVLWELSSHLYITTSSDVTDTVPASTVVVAVWI